MTCEDNLRTDLNILIVEDDPGARQRLSSAIQDLPDMQVIEAVSTLSAARAVIESSWPDVLLVDLGLPDGDGTELIREVSSSPGRCEIMVITVFGDEKHILRAIEAGATGYLLKEEESDQIGRCIHQLVEGGSPISAPIARHLLSQFRKDGLAETNATDSDNDAPQLTERETEVLRLIAKGYNSNEISEVLEVTYHTVTSHVRNIYRKLAVHSRSEAVFEAVQRGLVKFST
ncbi:MAG: response regulator transcription factor [Candidatus Thiodiazotropha sp.]